MDNYTQVQKICSLLCNYHKKIYVRISERDFWILLVQFPVGDGVLTLHTLMHIRLTELSSKR